MILLNDILSLGFLHSCKTLWAFPTFLAKTMRRRTVALKPFNSFMTVGENSSTTSCWQHRNFSFQVKNDAQMGVVKHLQLWPKILKNQLLITLQRKAKWAKRETSKKPYKSYPFTQPCNSSSQIPTFFLLSIYKMFIVHEKYTFFASLFKTSLSILSILPRPNNWHST